MNRKVNFYSSKEHQETYGNVSIKLISSLPYRQLLWGACCFSLNVCDTYTTFLGRDVSLAINIKDKTYVTLMLTYTLMWHRSHRHLTKTVTGKIRTNYKMTMNCSHLLFLLENHTFFFY